MNIAISLGHNSSAVAIDNNGNVLCGYEQERFDRIKSSSFFPKDALNEIFKHVKPEESEDINFYVSHWYNNFNFIKDHIDIYPKHWDWEYFFNLNKIYPKNKINFYSLFLK